LTLEVAGDAKSRPESKYLTFAQSGEEIVIWDRNLPVAKLVPFSTDEGTEEEQLLVTA
jgi:antitoxin (DNA-binding transcriptional repressor) of toxin-antitoxin stability system